MQILVVVATIRVQCLKAEEEKVSVCKSIYHRVAGCLVHRQFLFGKIMSGIEDAVFRGSYAVPNGCYVLKPMGLILPSHKRQGVLLVTGDGICLDCPRNGSYHQFWRAIFSSSL